MCYWLVSWLVDFVCSSAGRKDAFKEGGFLKEFLKLTIIISYHLVEICHTTRVLFPKSLLEFPLTLFLEEFGVDRNEGILIIPSD